MQHSCYDQDMNGEDTWADKRDMKIDSVFLNHRQLRSILRNWNGHRNILLDHQNFLAKCRKH